MNLDTRQGIGEAWLAFAAELQQQLRERDPEAVAEATIAPSGLLQLGVRTTSNQRPFALALARRYEGRAASTCERCGGRVTVAGSGPVVTILCARCQ